MLYIPKVNTSHGPVWARSSRDLGNPGDISFLIRLIYRYRKIYTGAALLGILAGLAIYAALPRRYEASSQAVIDFRRLANVNPTEATFNYRLSDAAVDNQTAVMKSDSVMGRAVEKLRLTEDEEFVGGRSTILTPLYWLGVVADPAARTPADLHRDAMAGLRRATEIRRIGISYALEIVASTRNPVKSAQVADGLMAAFVDDQLQARLDVAGGANGWFRDQMAELQAKLTEAERKSVDFRLQNHIVLADGKFIDETQVEDLSLRLLAAQGRRIIAEARVNRVQAIIAEQ
jgi:succinoglycan biosynthesis transport protein ExoP